MTFYSFCSWWGDTGLGGLAFRRGKSEEVTGKSIDEEISGLLFLLQLSFGTNWMVYTHKVDTPQAKQHPETGFGQTNPYTRSLLDA